MLKKILYYSSYIKFFVIVICVSIVYWNVKNEDIISETLQKIELKNFIFPLILGIVIMTLWSNLIYNTLKGTLNLNIKFQTWAKIFFNSQFYNFIPFAGFFYKGIQLNRYNISYKNYLFNYLFIIWSFSIFAFLIYAIEIAIFVDYKLNFFFVPIVLLFPFLSLSIFLLPKISELILNKIKTNNRIKSFFEDLSIFLNRNIKKKKIRNKFFFNVLTIHLFDFLLYVSVVEFLDIPISIKTIFLIWLINTIIDLFPITPQNIAVSELLAAFTGTLLGINFTSGILVRIFVRLSWICSAIIVFIFSNLFLRFEETFEKNKNYQICNRCVMDTSDKKITFNLYGICDYCQNFDKKISKYFSEKNYNSGKLQKISGIIKSSKKKNQKYDCLIGISGGVDSCYLAHIVKKVLKLNPLVLHVDTGWNSKEAVNNIEKIIDKLDLDLHTDVINWREMRDLQISFFKAQLPNLDIPQDHAIFGSIYNFAIKNNFKYILTGGNFSTECIREPLEWAYHASDLKHIKDVHKKFGKENLKTFPFSDIFKYKLYYRFFKGLKTIQPLNFVNYNKNQAINILEKEYGWTNYGHKHYESRFTKFFEGYWLKKKFGYDKRRAHFSSLILTNQMKRKDALDELKSNAYDENTINNEINYICSKLNITLNELNTLMEGKNKTFKDYKSANRLIKFFVKICQILNLENRLIR